MRQRLEWLFVVGIVVVSIFAALAIFLMPRPAPGQIVISDVTARPGDALDVIVSFSENDAQYVAASLDVILPDVLDPGPVVACATIQTHDNGGAFIVSRGPYSSEVRLILLDFETVEVLLPIGELVRCRVNVPVDARPGRYVIGCADAHAAQCADAETRDCALQNYPLTCPPAVALIEAPFVPTPSPTATIVPAEPTRMIAGESSGEPLLSRAESGSAGCEIYSRPQRSPATAALLALGLLFALMVYPRG